MLRISFMSVAAAAVRGDSNHNQTMHGSAHTAADDNDLERIAYINKFHNSQQRYLLSYKTLSSFVPLFRAQR